MRKSWKHGAAWAAAHILLLLPVGAAAGERQCTLKEIASVDLVTAANGRPLVPIKINGISETFALDLEDAFSFVDWDAGSELKLPEILLPHADITFPRGGEPLIGVDLRGTIRALVASTVEIAPLTRLIHGK